MKNPGLTHLRGHEVTTQTQAHRLTNRHRGAHRRRDTGKHRHTHRHKCAHKQTCAQRQAQVQTQTHTQRHAHAQTKTHTHRCTRAHKQKPRPYFKRWRLVSRGRDPKVEKPWVNSFPAQIAGPFCPGHNEPVHLIVQTQVSLITLIIALPARPCYIRGSQQQSLEGPVNEHNHFLSVIKVALCLRIVFVWSSGWPATSLKSLAFRTLVRCI